MSAEFLGVANEMRTAQRKKESACYRSPGWSPDGIQKKFAREQIGGLVRQVFSSSRNRPVRQVVLSAVEPETDVRSICRQVGEALALETLGAIAVVGEYPQLLEDWQAVSRPRIRTRNLPLRRSPLDRRESVAGARWRERTRHDRLCISIWSRFAGVRLLDCGGAVRRDPTRPLPWPVCRWHDSRAVGAIHAARAARRIKERLQKAQVRILGTVLSDREFPIPERIYRRL